MLFFIKTNKNRLLIQEGPESLQHLTGFTPFTEEQVAFYEAYPEASVQEIKQCKLMEISAPYVPTLEEEQKEAVSFLSQYSLNTLDRFVSAYQLANAQCSVLWAESNNKGEPPIYDLKTAQGYIDTYLRIGGLCRAKFYEAKGLIESAVNKTEIEEIKASAISYYDTLE